MFAFNVALEILLKSHWSFFLHINLPQWDCYFELIFIRLFRPTCYKFLSGTWIVQMQEASSFGSCLQNWSYVFSISSICSHPFSKISASWVLSYITLNWCCFKWISKPIFLSLCAYQAKTYVILYRLKVFVPITFLAFAILVPVNWTNATLEGSNVTFSNIDKLSISNVPNKSQRWAMTYLSARI